MAAPKRKSSKAKALEARRRRDKARRSKDRAAKRSIDKLAFEIKAPEGLYEMMKEDAVKSFWSSDHPRIGENGPEAVVGVALNKAAEGDNGWAAAGKLAPVAERPTVLQPQTFSITRIRTETTHTVGGVSTTTTTEVTLDGTRLSQPHDVRHFVDNASPAQPLAPKR